MMLLYCCWCVMYEVGLRQGLHYVVLMSFLFLYNTGN